MGLAEILGVAGSISLLSGWRLYLTILATGVAMHFGWLPLPEHLQALQILANPWVMGVAAVGTLAEFLADKIAWVDSIWDSVHSIVRPLGGALLALALIDSADPAWQVITSAAYDQKALDVLQGRPTGDRGVATTPQGEAQFVLEKVDGIDLRVRE